MAPTLQAVLEWQEKEHERQLALASATGNAVDAASRDAEDAAAASQFVAFVPLPDQKVSKVRGGVGGGPWPGRVQAGRCPRWCARPGEGLQAEGSASGPRQGVVDCALPCFLLTISTKAIELRVLEKINQDLLANKILFVFVFK